MPVTSMNHFTVLAEDLTATTKFYVELLGLREGARPTMSFPGAWLYAGEQAVLHIIAGKALPDEPAGVLDHMAFTATDLPATIALLQTRGIEYTLSRQQDTELWQLFLFDPNGARVELVFAAEEGSADSVE